MSESPLTKEIDQLLRDLLDGEWDEFKQRRLDEILRQSRSARVQYRQTMQIDAMLDPMQQGVDLSSAVAGSADTRSFRFSMSLRWAMAALLAIGATMWMISRTGPSPVVPVVHAEPDAVISRLLDVEWAKGASILAVGSDPGEQWIKVTSGIIQIDFRDGARLVVKGPARFRVESSSACRVDLGRLTVLAEGDASGFTIEAKRARVIDLGTEFGVVVLESGAMKVSVLDGQVEVATVATKNRPSAKQVLIAQEAAEVRSDSTIQKIEFDAASFEPIRAKTLWRQQLIRLQLDCGNRSGTYRGIESPAHATGDMHSHESYWHLVVADQSGRIQLADGQISPQAITIDCGVGRPVIDWSSELDQMRRGIERTHGVFATPLGQDNINAVNRNVGLRLKGLPRGRYRVYVVARPALHNPNWGNYLVNKAASVSIGIHLDRHGIEAKALTPLTDPNAGAWVDGQTHTVVELNIAGPDEFLSVIASRDRKTSPQTSGGRSVIQAVQIIQLPAKP
jgi:ferric-dicitrate binding protein FerR (iron transport regulator)